MGPFIVAGRLAAVAVLLASPSLVSARDVTAGTLLIQHPWIRATPSGAQVAGGYATIVNKGPAPDRLVGGSVAAAAHVELHSMAMDGSVMTMRPSGPIEIPAGGSVTLAPSGTHIMFTGLKHGFKKGEAVDGSLVFEHAGAVSVRFTVEAIGAKGPAKDDAADHAMPGMDMD